MVNMVATSTFSIRSKISPTPASHSWKWATTRGVGPGTRLRNWRGGGGGGGEMGGEGRRSGKKTINEVVEAHCYVKSNQRSKL